MRGGGDGVEMNQLHDISWLEWSGLHIQCSSNINTECQSLLEIFKIAPLVENLQIESMGRKSPDWVTAKKSQELVTGIKSHDWVTGRKSQELVTGRKSPDWVKGRKFPDWVTGKKISRLSHK